MTNKNELWIGHAIKMLRDTADRLDNVMTGNLDIFHRGGRATRR